MSYVNVGEYLWDIRIRVGLLGCSEVTSSAFLDITKPQPENMSVPFSHILVNIVINF